MKRHVLCGFFLIVSYFVYSGEIDIPSEYTRLYTDLLNLASPGYKSFFDGAALRAGETVNLSQGALRATGSPLHCAIAGEGFFKIRFPNGEAAYTRSGEFSFDSEGNLITQKNGYALYEPVRAEGIFLPDTLRITRGGGVFIGVMDKTGNVTETKAGELRVYRIPGKDLIHYEGAVYTTEQPGEVKEDTTDKAFITQGCLEESNYETLPVMLRMYYLLSRADEGLIPGLEFKKDLLRTAIDNLSDPLFSMEEIILAMYRRAAASTEIPGRANGRDIGVMKSLTEIPQGQGDFSDEFLTARYIEHKWRFLKTILPYLRLGPGTFPEGAEGRGDF